MLTSNLRKLVCLGYAKKRQKNTQHYTRFWAGQQKKKDKQSFTKKQ